MNEHRLLVETYQRESNVNKRLSLENEELAWKLRQREEIIMSSSCPPGSSTASTLGKNFGKGSGKVLLTEGRWRCVES